MRERQQSSTTHPMAFLMVLASDHLTGAPGLSPTVTVSKDGAALASPAGAVTEIGGGWYALAGNATDRNTLGEFLIHATAATADPSDTPYTVVAYDPFDAVRLGLTALPAVAAGSAGGLPIGLTGGRVNLGQWLDSAPLPLEAPGVVQAYIPAGSIADGAIEIRTLSTEVRIYFLDYYMTSAGAGVSAGGLDNWAITGTHGTSGGVTQPYFEGQFLGYFVWYNGSGWTVSSALGVNGSGYWTTAGGAPQTGPYSPQGTATGVPVFTAHGNACLAAYQPDGPVSAALAAAGLDSVIVEAGINARQALALTLDATIAKLSGATGGTATDTVTLRDVNDTADRATFDVDVNGNRTLRTLHPPA